MRVCEPRVFNCLSINSTLSNSKWEKQENKSQQATGFILLCKKRKKRRKESKSAPWNGGQRETWAFTSIVGTSFWFPTAENWHVLSFQNSRQNEKWNKQRKCRYQFPKQCVRCVLMYLFKKGKDKKWKGLDEFLMDLRPEFMTARSLEFKKTRARGSRWRLSVINRVGPDSRARVFQPHDTGE